MKILLFLNHKKLIARVHLNYDELDNEFNLQNFKESEARKKVNDLLNQILNDVNKKVSTFSKLNKIIEQAEPFEKTPTKKIKRYLYN